MRYMYAEGASLLYPPHGAGGVAIPTSLSIGGAINSKGGHHMDGHLMASSPPPVTSYLFFFWPRRFERAGRKRTKHGQMLGREKRFARNTTSSQRKRSCAAKCYWRTCLRSVRGERAKKKRGVSKYHFERFQNEEAASGFNSCESSLAAGKTAARRLLAC